MLCGQYEYYPIAWSLIYNDRPTSPMHPLMNWEGCQPLYGWLKLMVHHIPSQARARCVPVFFHPPMLHPWSWSIMWPVWVWSHCLISCAMVYQPHTLTHGWIERSTTTCMDGWNSWYMVQSKLSKAEAKSVCVVFHPCWSILGVYVASMGVILLLGWWCNVISTSHINTWMNWEENHHLYGCLELMLHDTSHTIQGRG